MMTVCLPNGISDNLKLPSSSVICAISESTSWTFAPTIGFSDCLSTTFPRITPVYENAKHVVKQIISNRIFFILFSFD